MQGGKYGGWYKSGWLIAATICLAVLALQQLPNWEDLNGRTFDTLSTLEPLTPEEPGIVIIAIDEPSMAAFQEPWPWPRDRHAELIKSLRAAGAKAIAFDVVFAEAGDPEADAELADAGGSDVVFAADETLIERDYGTSLIVTQPLPLLLENGAQFGIASLSMDGDGVLRRMPRYTNGFVARLLEQTGRKPNVAQDGGNLIQYFGGPGSYPTVSYYQALEPGEFLPPDFFQDQVVIIGYALQANADVNSGTADAFETPYTAHTNYLTPGVEVQATIYDNFRQGLSITPPPIWSAFALILLGALLGLTASRPQSPLRKIFIALLFTGLLVLTSWLALRYGRIWLSPVESIVTLLGVVVAIAARDFTAEQRRRREVQSAFGQYVSPDMVRRIIRDPSLLNLGGESRKMTILFADIRGFTAISEAMKDEPQNLTAMINDILTPLSNIVIEHGGTIDKYMGDCIMAFWNAPLDDPDHAAHAVAAAKAMLAEMDSINRALKNQYGTNRDLPEIRIGIGVNSGDVVVGNMGSKQRFDYSVLGDAVNIASRIEGLCKEYATSLIVGEDTVRIIGEERFEKLDTISVRGRAEPKAIYQLG